MRTRPCAHRNALAAPDPFHVGPSCAKRHLFPSRDASIERASMKIIKVETIRNREPIPLPEPWLPAWSAPGGTPATSFGFSFHRVYTDEGIVGVGPDTGASPRMLLGLDPFTVGEFWDQHMSGRRPGMSGRRAAGLEIALWDIVGKAAGLSVAKMLGGRRDRIPVYAATSRLLDVDEHVRQVTEIAALGFKAVKLRLHRANPWDDVAVVEAVRDAVGDDLILLVDANQNNHSPGYEFWDRQTAMRVARELDRLRVYFMEEPLPRDDIAGLAEIAAAVDMFVAGGEHTPTAYDFRDHLTAGAYDVVQPDVTLMGNMGIIGLRKVADMADASRRLVIPHVTGGGTFPFYLAATLHAMATVDNCPMIEFPYDPPVLTAETLQVPVAEPLCPDEDGCLTVPQGPGIGIELDERVMASGVVVSAEE